jgi:alpha-galactosidase
MYHLKRGFPPALHLMLLNVAIAAHRTPPMGWSSWNHFGMRVSAPLLLAVADELDSRGLKDSGYVYVNTDDGWNDKNRTAGRSGALHPATTFSNASEGIKALADGLRAKGFRFGIYLAAGFTTCGNRAGSLYYERQDAAQIAAAGVDYLKYDDCGEANLQSYAKYHVMKDALDSAYAFRGGVDYYSFEPFQVYNGVAIQEMGWTATVGDLWRTGGDIRPVWKSIMSNAHANDHWAPNGRPGHYNDADMLEIGNGQLTLAEQRAHFSLWCVQKSPLIIGADVAQLSAESLAILRNEGLIRVNQDELGIQGTLRAATGDYASTPTVTAGAPAITIPAQGSDFVGNCSFGAAAATQRWRIVPVPGGGTALANADGKRFLARDAGSKAVVVSECVAVGCGGAALFDVGRANETLSQIRDAEDATSCLAYDGTSLHMEACRVETGDAANASDCWEHNCRFSSLSDQLFYLNSLGQLSLAWTNFQAPRGLPPRVAATNIPMCVVAEGGAQQGPTPLPPPPAVNSSQPHQVWAGPLSGGDVALLLLNTGDAAANITAWWADIGLERGAFARATDLFTGRTTTETSSLAATVATHDVAAFRLTPV